MREEEVLNPEGDEADQTAGPESTADAEPVAEASLLDEGEPLGSVETGPAAELEAALAEVGHWKDMAQRAAADAQNTRQRAERDVEKAHKFALDKFSQELLPVVDSLEQAMVAADAENELLKPMLEGISMTHKLFLDTLARFNVECLDPEGEPFNPEYHEAMSVVEAPNAEPNSVLQVYQKGYLLNGRLVRAAKVVVSKAASN